MVFICGIFAVMMHDGVEGILKASLCPFAPFWNLAADHGDFFPWERIRLLQCFTTNLESSTQKSKDHKQIQ